VRPPRITYVSNLRQQLAGGGPYAVNWHAFDQLSRRFDARYAGPLGDLPLWVEPTVSELRRKASEGHRHFDFLSGSSLEQNAAEVARHTRDADAIVFRSATQWSRSRPSVKYFVYLDVAFHTFFFNTFRIEDFSRDDLERIWREEAAFLEGASGVFFDSRWGMQKALGAYGLKGDHYFAPGRGGVIQPPSADTWSGASRKLISVAVNFWQKGGDRTLAAFKELKPQYPALRWHIVGGEPQAGWESVNGVTYEGTLRPDVPEERSRLQALLADAFLLVHPTREDTSPLVLTEAAYFGCPAVSVNLFGIPEFVEHGKTGVLLEPPVTSHAVAATIAGLLDDPHRYLAMRKHARATALEKYSWNRVGAAICDHIQRTLTAA